MKITEVKIFEENLKRIKIDCDLVALLNTAPETDLADGRFLRFNSIHVMNKMPTGDFTNEEISKLSYYCDNGSYR